jgi:gamma-F420-2:alpha-L-glutamate ligase
LRTAQLSQLDIAGVDLLMDDDGYKVCEVNSAPGFEGLERASAVNVAAECVKFVVHAIEQHRAQKAVTKPVPLLRVPLQADHMAVASLLAEHRPIASPVAITSPVAATTNGSANGTTTSSNGSKR